jgi:hypothetical protein
LDLLSSEGLVGTAPPGLFTPNCTAVTEINHKNFGYLIAYVLPGFVAVWGAGYLIPTVRVWLAPTAATLPTIGGFLYVTLAAVAAGMTISAVRWATIDTLHRFTGLRRPEWDFSNLQDNLDAFEAVVEEQYRYYQFYSHMVVALAFAYIARRLAVNPLAGWSLIDSGVVIVEMVLLAASRNALQNYFARVGQMLGIVLPHERKVKYDQRFPRSKQDQRPQDDEDD